jgi:hypothetical protein
MVSKGYGSYFELEEELVLVLLDDVLLAVLFVEFVELAATIIPLSMSAWEPLAKLGEAKKTRRSPKSKVNLRAL